MARYILRARGAAGPIEFQERMTIEAALAKAQELRARHFTQITILNVLSGVEITNVETLLASNECKEPDSQTPPKAGPTERS